MNDALDDVFDDISPEVALRQRASAAAETVEMGAFTETEACAAYELTPQELEIGRAALARRRAL